MQRSIRKQGSHKPKHKATSSQEERESKVKAIIPSNRNSKTTIEYQRASSGPHTITDCNHGIENSYMLRTDEIC